MGSTVDAPGGVECEAVTESSGGVEGDEGSLSPEEDRDDGWEDKAEKGDEW